MIIGIRKFSDQPDVYQQLQSLYAISINSRKFLVAAATEFDAIDYVVEKYPKFSNLADNREYSAVLIDRADVKTNPGILWEI